MWRHPLHGDCITEAQRGWSETQEGPTARQWTGQVFCLNSVSPTTAGERLGGVHVLWGAVLPRLGASGGSVRGSELGGGVCALPLFPARCGVRADQPREIDEVLSTFQASVIFVDSL